MLANSQNGILGNMENDLAQFTSGTNAEKTMGFQRALQSWAPGIASAVGIDPNSVAAQESFHKLVAQIADAQGAGSDARLAVNQGANPNEELSPTGAAKILHMLRGNADYNVALNKVAVAHPGLNYSQLVAGPAAEMDPRVFQYNRMNSDEKRQYFKSASTADKNVIKSKYDTMQAQGLLNGGQ